MNAQELAFTVHDGDLKAGKGTPGSVTPTTCSNDKYTQALTYFKLLKAPAAFTPGDNDWTDCDNPSNGPFNSLERLDHERALFFSTPFTFGQHHLRQAVQTDITPCKGFVAGDFTELPTRRKPASRIVAGRCAASLMPLEIQGSCDNRCKESPDNTRQTLAEMPISRG
jgi:hypothetical protein